MVQRRDKPNGYSELSCQFRYPFSPPQTQTHANLHTLQFETRANLENEYLHTQLDTVCVTI